MAQNKQHVFYGAKDTVHVLWHKRNSTCFSLAKSSAEIDCPSVIRETFGGACFCIFPATSSYQSCIESPGKSTNHKLKDSKM